MAMFCVQHGAMEDAIVQRLMRAGLLTADGTPRKELVHACLDLTRSFTTERMFLAKQYFARGRRIDAYLAAFMLPNVAKIEHLLRTFPTPLPPRGSINVLDIGSGPGTAALAVSQAFKELRPAQPVHILCVEEQRSAAAVAHDLCGHLLPKHHRAEFVVSNAADLERVAVGRRFHLAIAGNVLNELADDDARLRLVRSALTISDAFIAVDPALRPTTRSLMRLRDLLILDGAAVSAPCTHTMPCPMLATNDRDWCHFYIEWHRPPLIAALDQATGLNHRHLKLAYLIAGGFGGPAATGTVGGGRCGDCKPWRVVSSPLCSRGKIELVLCGGQGELRRLCRLNKHASRSNAAFEDVRRGDLVALSDLARPSSCGAGDVFEIVNRFNPA